MKKIAIGAGGALLVAAATGAAIVHAGGLDVSASTPHADVVHDLIEWARERAIARQVRDIVLPASLDDSERIRRGAGNYEAMCVGCHLTPAVRQSELRDGLYPQPPDLVQSLPEASDARRFWIIKYGLKASGMPAWQKGGMEDAAIWDLTAFLKVLPTLSPAQYRQLVAASDGHSHHGVAPEAPAKLTGAPSASLPRHAHDHTAHKH